MYLPQRTLVKFFDERFIYLVIDVVGGTYIDEFICAHDSMIFFDRHPQHRHPTARTNARIPLPTE